MPNEEKQIESDVESIEEDIITSSLQETPQLGGHRMKKGVPPLAPKQPNLMAAASSSTSKLKFTGMNFRKDPQIQQ